MAVINEGTVSVSLPDGIEVPAKAGHLSDQDVRRLNKVRLGLGLACVQTAAELEKSTSDFVVPGVNATQLRTAGEQADMWDEIISDLELALRVAKQANLLVDADAFNMLRKVNAQVKAQVAFEPKLKERFTTVSDYFSNSKRKAPVPEEV